MTKDYKTLSKKNFDEQSGYYDTTPIGSVSKYPKLCYPFVIDRLKNHTFTSLLDLGCGTGATTELLRNAYPEVSLSGLDLSENMITVARKKAVAGAEFTVGDAENLPYADRSFDAIICVQSIHHYPDAPKAIAEVHRVLRSDGIFIVCDMHPPAPVRFLFNNLLFRFMKTGDVHLYDKPEFDRLFRQAGFRKTEWEKIHPVMFMYCGTK